MPWGWREGSAHKWERLTTNAPKSRVRVLWNLY
jgi:hypothetical protein